MVYDIYGARIGIAQQNIAVVGRILDGTWTGTDLFELMVLLRVYVRTTQAEQQLFVKRVRTGTMGDEDRKTLEALISSERCALHDARERHERDVRLGVKY